ncbi:class III extradiol ring-cleavage dioxygenase family protein [Gordonia insulae]|uniref:hypothetical protein n=1 Tax=Gordonia insulae TaxID=2420509 RepID=UPI000F5BF0CA|nr:hypothetical protein [Gordonia insulae]
MLASVVFVPSAPLLLPALAGPQAIDTGPVRAATLAAVHDLADTSTTWIAIGVADSATASRPGLGQDVPTAGSFARYGVDVAASLRRETASGDSGRDLPLSMLIAGWLRAETEVGTVEPVVMSPDATPAECARIGVDLGARVDAADGRVGVLVVGDGAISLSAKAPGGGLRASAVALQARIDTAISDADTAALAALDADDCAAEGVSGRTPWQVAAQLCRDRPMVAHMHYAQAPFGVGYVVATWTPR